jgi:Pyruvate/2-oxoacid:ferredoxin oxidoreductase delta subunit
VAHAIGHGRTVAEGVFRWFEVRDTSEAEVPESPQDVVTPDKIRISYFPFAPPHQDRHLPTAARTGGFHEVSMGLTDTEEAQRCFSCGHCTQCDTCMMYCPEGIVTRGSDGYAISGDYCKGCGICVWECPRNAMRMTAEGSG